jgi:ectoine hydroxylase-related dioxygenase (phytanoyl-CoA dioxygenase family)
MQRRTMIERSHSLSRDEIQRFHDEGYLGPFVLCSPAQMVECRAQIVEQVLSAAMDRPDKQRHLDARVVYDLCTHPAVLDRIESLVGPDILLWQSRIVSKEPGAKLVTWHTDDNYLRIEPRLNFSAWIALDETTEHNGAVRMLPGTHKLTIPHIPTSEDVFSPMQADPRYFDADGPVVEMRLRPGQFFLFTDRTLHQSPPNNTAKTRLGLAVRFTAPLVRVDHDLGVLVVRGEDRLGFNKIVSPPDR